MAAGDIMEQRKLDIYKYSVLKQKIAEGLKNG